MLVTATLESVKVSIELNSRHAHHLLETYKAPKANTTIRAIFRFKGVFDL